MSYNNSYNPVDAISLILETHFQLLRNAQPRQKLTEQINNELVYIVEKAINCSDNPKYTLIQLGIIIFPGSIAIKKSRVCKLMSICKTGLESRLKNAGWNSSDIYCISNVQNCLKKIVRNDYKIWKLKAIPKGSSFERFVNLHPEVVHCKNKIISSEEFFVMINSSQVSSPIPHQDD